MSAWRKDIMRKPWMPLGEAHVLLAYPVIREDNDVRAGKDCRHVLGCVNPCERGARMSRKA